MARACYTLLSEQGKTNIGDDKRAGCSAESESHAASIKKKRRKEKKERKEHQGRAVRAGAGGTRPVP